MPVPLHDPSSTAAAADHAPARAYAALAVLTLAYVFSFLDRIVVNLLVEPMRRDLGLSDTQISLLMGLSFAVFYTLCGLPLGWLADRCNRRTLIAVGVTVWSAMTVACGLVRGYGGLFVARLGVGAGEATLTPAAHSMIADLFPSHRLGRAMSVYALGIYLGSGLALLLGALAIRLAEWRTEWVLPLVGPVFPWQMVFVFVGLPGLLVALLVLTLREPARRGAATPVAWHDALRWMRQERGFLLRHHLGFALLSLVAYASAGWIPTALVRGFGWTTVQAALCFGGMTVVFSVLGCLAGGLLSDRLAHLHGGLARVRVGVWSALGLLVACAGFALAPGAGTAAAMLAPMCFFVAMPFGAASAVLVEHTPPALRGQASALYLMAISVIGIGLGPTAVALCTEQVFADPAAVRWSIGLVGGAGSVLAGALLYRLGWPATRGETAKRAQVARAA